VQGGGLGRAAHTGDGQSPLIEWSFRGGVHAHEPIVLCQIGDPDLDGEFNCGKPEVLRL